MAADGALRFLDDRYVGPDGAVYLFASELTRAADGGFRMISRYREGEAWKEMWRRDFTRR